MIMKTEIAQQWDIQFRNLDAPGHAVDRPPADAPPLPPPPRRRRSPATTRSPVAIEGVGDLPVTMARCCNPAPPEPISGYLTLARGVTIHRAQCPSFIRMRARNPERVLHVDWNAEAERPPSPQIRPQPPERFAS